MKRSIALVALSAGCATTPTPDFKVERDYVFGRSDVLCFVASNQNVKDQYPQGFEFAKKELERRTTVCTPEMVDTGAQAIVTQAEREKRVTAMQSQERQESAGRITDRVMRGLVGFATGYALGAAMQPPPPAIAPAPMLNCTTRYVGTTAYTNCH